jgi:UDP-N-acetylmuramoyl-L-alanyl-D-glutamate--2,6-diaminopimelate ligase
VVPAIPVDVPAPSTSVPWRALLGAASRRAWNGTPLAGLSEDSREVGPGWIFVAHGGQQTDGHRYIADAAAAGAALVVCERPQPCPVPICVVGDARAALSELAAAWFRNPARHMRLIGVTGTNGKTSTAALTAAVLSAAGFHPCTIGTLGVRLRDQTLRELPWTTPPPVQLHGALAEALAAGADSCVMEVSAQAVSQNRVADCPFEVAAITNLSREHFEYYADRDAYVQAKADLFRHLARRPGRPGIGVLNRRLEDLATFRKACPGPTVEYGPGGDIEVVSTQPRALAGTDIAVRWPGRAAPVGMRVRLPGDHNVENAVCAAAVAAALDLPPSAAAAGVAAVHSVAGRLEQVVRRPVRVIVDYAHNPAGLRALLQLLRRSTRGRLLVVMGARGGRDPGKRPLMGAIVAAFADQVVLTSDRPAPEDPAGAAEPMRRAVHDCGVPVRFVRDRLEAFQEALAGRSPGDCVVAVGKGRERWIGDSATAGLDDVSAFRLVLGIAAS